MLRWSSQAGRQGHKAACEGFHPGVLAQSCKEQLELSLHESNHFQWFVATLQSKNTCVLVFSKMISSSISSNAIKHLGS